MTNDSQIPDDHPIRALWRNNELQQSVQGLIQLAREGDAHAAKELIAMFNFNGRKHIKNIEALGPHRAANDTTMKELLEYVFECFADVLNGEKADISLNLTTGKKGRPKKNYSDMQKESRIGYHVVLQMRDEKITLEQACEDIAAREHVSAKFAKDAYIKYMA